MRRLLALVGCFAVTVAAADIRTLRQLADASRIFELREALQQPNGTDSETLFYRGLVESRFGQEDAGVTDLRKFLATSVDPATKRKAYEELSSALLRLGRYGESAGTLAEALRLTPPNGVERAGNENSRALYESLADVPPETVEFGGEVSTQASHNSLGSWDVPVELNGRRGEWIFDTGANFSTLTESEAARLGLTLRETHTYVNGSTGKKNPLRLAVARDLQFGRARLSNVVFLVLSDKALYIAPLHYQIRGILGLPAIRALGCVAISEKGDIQIETERTGGATEPNLFFDGQDVILDARHEGHRLQMFLDTGANTTTLYLSSRAALTSGEIAALNRKDDKTGGAGGVVRRTADVIPTLALQVQTRTVELTDVSLLLSQLMGEKSYRDGVLGMDGLSSGFVLDFNSMQLRLN